jgi:hypothetical protein
LCKARDLCQNSAARTPSLPGRAAPPTRAARPRAPQTRAPPARHPRAHVPVSQHPRGRPEGCVALSLIVLPNATHPPAGALCKTRDLCQNSAARTPSVPGREAPQTRSGRHAQRCRRGADGPRSAADAERTTRAAPQTRSGRTRSAAHAERTTRAAPHTRSGRHAQRRKRGADDTGSAANAERTTRAAARTQTRSGRLAGA